MKYLVVNIDNGDCHILDGEHKLAHNFKVKEFACKDGSDVIVVSFKAIVNLQILRHALGVPLSFISAFRTISHNESENGAKESRHLFGDGFDIGIPRGYTPDSFGIEILKLFGHEIGFHVYNTWVHVDFRGHKARW